MDEADVSIEAYKKLRNSIPPMGFLSQKKRVIAFLRVTKLAQQMIDEQKISEDNALYLLSTLARNCAPFHKAVMMTALHLANINRKQIQPVGFKYANNMRCNMQMLPIDDDI